MTSNYTVHLNCAKEAKFLNMAEIQHVAIRLRITAGVQNNLEEYLVSDHKTS